MSKTSMDVSLAEAVEMRRRQEGKTGMPVLLVGALVSQFNLPAEHHQVGAPAASASSRSASAANAAIAFAVCARSGGTIATFQASSTCPGYNSASRPAAPLPILPCWARTWPRPIWPKVVGEKCCKTGRKRHRTKIGWPSQEELAEAGRKKEALRQVQREATPSGEWRAAVTRENWLDLLIGMPLIVGSFLSLTPLWLLVWSAL